MPRPDLILRQPIPDRLVVLTFDDACASHAAFVAPLLKKHSFGATFFICEYPGFETDKKAYMTWEQIASLDTMGFELANHTRTHKHVDRQKKEELSAELEYIEKQFADRKIARPVSFAYPAYATHPLAFSVLEERGYQFARIGGSRPYQPLKDLPLLIPSFSTSGTKRTG